MDNNRLNELRAIADNIRKMTIEEIGKFGVGHIGGSTSVTETLTCLYHECANIDPTNPDWSDRDRIVMSKGHAGPGLYAALVSRGYFDRALLDTLNKNGTSLPSHCDMTKTVGVDFTAGSLGQGLSAAVGMALAAKMDRKNYRVYCIVGDGESQEGQIWEAVMFAAHKKLNNLTILIDNNKMQIDGTTDEVCKIAPFESKYKAFGYRVFSVDGHDIEQIVDAIESTKRPSSKPACIVLNTIKGKGVKCCEGTVKSHSVAFTEEMWRKEVYREENN